MARIFALLLLLALILPAHAGDQGFVSAIDDLPLMPGLTEETEGTVVFDTPAGRIVEVGPSERLVCLSGQTSVRRSGDGTVTVRFSLVPATGP